MPASEPSPAAKASSPFASWIIDHAGIRVPDFEEAVAWCTDTLDFRLLRCVTIGKLTFGFSAPATDNTFSFEILAGPGAAPRPPYEELHDSYDILGWHHLGIRVDDVDATVNELKRRDVRIISETHDVEVMGLRPAFFTDPWGNMLEVIAPIWCVGCGKLAPTAAVGGVADFETLAIASLGGQSLRHVPAPKSVRTVDLFLSMRTSFRGVLSRPYLTACALRLTKPLGTLALNRLRTIGRQVPGSQSADEQRVSEPVSVQG